MVENQLVAEAEQLDDLDEFAGLSVRDIASAIIHWPEGSEDQYRAIAALRARAPGVGHNRPPLEEALSEELAPLKGRAGQLLEAAATSVIIDDESARKVTDLSAMIRALEGELTEARKKRVAPFLAAQRTVNDRHNELIRPLEVARQGDTGRGGLRGMLTAWEDKKEAEVEAERQRLQAEARRREEEAAAARRAAEEQKAAGKSTVSDELDAMRAEDDADRLERRAQAIRPEPTRAHLGIVSRRRDIEFKIDNLRELLGWLAKQPGLSANLEQAVRTIVGAHLRVVGVETIATRGITIPGLSVSVVKGAANVRR